MIDDLREDVALACRRATRGVGGDDAVDEKDLRAADAAIETVLNALQAALAKGEIREKFFSPSPGNPTLSECLQLFFVAVRKQIRNRN